MMNKTLDKRISAVALVGIVIIGLALTYAGVRANQIANTWQHSETLQTVSSSTGK